MTSASATPGPLDVLDKQHPDEPRFILLGRDQCAPAAILAWVDARRKVALALPDRDAMRDELIKATEAEMLAHDMRRYRLGQPEQDTTSSARAMYSGTVADADTKVKIERHDALAGAIAHLREAAYHAEEARTALQRLGVIDGDLHFALQAAVETINLVAGEVAPKRVAA